MNVVGRLFFQEVESYRLHALAITVLLFLFRRGRLRHFVAAGVMMGFRHYRRTALAMAKDAEAGGEGHQQE